MNFPTMRPTTQFSKNISVPFDGFNRTDAKELLADNQFSDAINVYETEGAIHTRPKILENGEIQSGLRPQDVILMYETNRKDYIVLLAKNEIRLYKSNGEPIYHQSLIDYEIKSAFVSEYIDDLGDGTMELCLYIFAVATYGGQDGNYIFRLLPSIFSSSHTMIAFPVSHFAYVPTIFTSGVPADTYTDGASEIDLSMSYNLLTHRFKSTWITNGTGKYFMMPVQCTTESMSFLYLQGDDGALYRLGYENISGTVSRYNAKQNSAGGWDEWTGSITYFETTISSPRLNYNQSRNCFWVSDGETHIALPYSGMSGGIEIETSRKDWSLDSQDIIFKEKFSEWYGGSTEGIYGGNRLFVSGNEDEPSTVRFSDVDNPFYFPENNFVSIGEHAEKVTSFAKQSDALIVFKSKSTYCFRQFTIDVNANSQFKEQTAFFAPMLINGNIGCNLPKTICLCGNRLVWATNDPCGNVYTLSSLSNLSEKSIKCLSYRLGKTQKEFKGGSSATTWNKNYVLSTEDELLLFDYGASGFAYYSSYYDDKSAAKRIPWYSWNLNGDLKSFSQDIGGIKYTNIGKIEHVFGDNENLVFFKLASTSNNEKIIFCRSIKEKPKYFDISYNLSVDEINVAFLISTKNYSFGRPNDLKMIDTMYLHFVNSYPLYVGVDFGSEKSQRENGGNGTFDMYKNRLKQIENVSVNNETVKRIPCRQSRVRFVNATIYGYGDIGLIGFTWEYRNIGSVK